MTNQFQCMNLAKAQSQIKQQINSQLNSIDQKHDCLENDLSRVTTTNKEMKLEQPSTHAKMDNLEKTVEENQKTIADISAEIQVIVDSMSKVEDHRKLVREFSSKDNEAINLQRIEKKVDSLMSETEK